MGEVHVWILMGFNVVTLAMLLWVSREMSKTMEFLSEFMGKLRGYLKETGAAFEEEEPDA